ncbi:DUF4307 domain-containing protein [Streptomyces sp. TRM64462]|uniref:DUF4307 domain-containing protein n=1 Tax=Streptomyces sp. TRM64462 TaxID=2741726 RepID=UPI00158687FE|nr:DUF4307 domain-containing protein [Streptomyces sp. TRM64462]
MGVAGEQLPDGRYGRSAEERTDRRLKLVGSVLGVGLLALVGWFGYDYVAGQKISAEMIKFDVAAADRVDVHLEVRKESEARGYCTLRALAESGAEVGRKEFRFDEASSRIDRVVSVRTTERATAAELLGCTAD